MEFLTRTEVAKYFRVDPRTVERWLRSGKITGYKLGKGKTAPWRITMMDESRLNEAEHKISEVNEELLPRDEEIKYLQMLCRSISIA